MKKKILTCSAALFLLLGSVLLIAPQIANQIGKQEAHHLIEEFESSKQGYINSVPDKSEGEKESIDYATENAGVTRQSDISTTYTIDTKWLYSDSVAYNEMLKSKQYDLLKDKSYQSPALNLYDYGAQNNIYGYISASSIDMELPIYLGANEETMSYGAAHMTYTSLPIGGESTNCVLAAHTGYIGRIFFDNISRLDLGEKVEITNYWSTLTYEVKEKHIFKKYESSDCYIINGRDLLTLITCAHGGTERWYVICERV